MEELISAGYQAFVARDFARLHHLWCSTCAWSFLSVETVRELDNGCRAAIDSGEAGEWPYLVLGTLYLDRSADLMPDREKALRTVYEWGKQAIAIAPDNSETHRIAGSARYWLGENEAALEHYLRSDALAPQADLQARIFAIRNEPAGRHVTQFSVTGADEDPCRWYTAGVTVGQWQPETGSQRDRARELRLDFYERAVALFRKAEHPFDVHTFAMCCNNLGIVYNELSRTEDAVAILETGLEHADFRELHENIRWSFRDLGMTQEAAEASLTLLEDHDIDPKLFIDCAQTACSYLNRLGHSDDVLRIVDAAVDAWDELSAQEQMEEETLRFFIAVQSHRISALAALGTLQPGDIDFSLVRRAIAACPDELEFPLGHAKLLMDAQDYAAARTAYAELIARAHAANNRSILRQALSARGYMSLYFTEDVNLALKDYQALEALTPDDFYVYYYQADCYYRRQDHRQTLRVCALALERLPPGMAATDRLSLGQLFMMKANTLFDLGEYAASLPVYEQCLSFIDREGIRQNFEEAKKLASRGKGWLSRLLS